MSASTATFAAGIPVEIGQIDRELKKLWEQGGEMMTRASLINLAVYSEAPDALTANTPIIAQITEDHACRALVIAATPSGAEDGVSAWISAHCHVSRAGSKHVCSEQLSFAIEGSLTKLLPNIVFSHLDSDLPLYLWWQGEFHDPMDPQLWAWVDRLIFDSQSWTDFDGQMALVETAQAKSNQRVVLCDLNWTRLVQMRLALAQFFDQPASLALLAEIERVEIDFAAGYHSTAALLAGWLSAQLGWMTGEAGDETRLSFTDQCGQPVEVTLQETSAAAVGRCSIFCGATEFRVVHAAHADLIEVSEHREGKERRRQWMPAGKNEPVALMSEELMRGGRHHVYLRAFEAVREFF
ncbi:MAG TPA: glucose-6-phosphate dehydrogenase assembly protein OpcA [Chthoniobacterales bacterium]|nr:glucose-6-phosphate dehydrogenase assembly protein OpcA [Chthoniobacterales bacterium]